MDISEKVRRARKGVAAAQIAFVDKKEMRRMPRHGENIRKRNDGRWEARVLCGSPEQGKSRYKYLYSQSYAEVRAKKNQLLAAQAAKGKTSQITLAALMEEWLGAARVSVKESTYAKYVFAVERHILPALGCLPLAELTEDKISRFARGKLAHGGLRGNQGLSPKTVTGLLSVLGLALAFGRAAGYGCIDRTAIHYPKNIWKESRALSLGEQNALESYLFRKEPTPIGAGIILSLYTGLRLGEVCALRWEDISFENATLRVQRTLTRIQSVSSKADAPKTRLVMGEPKTEKSNRIIPLPAFLARFLLPLRGEDGQYLLTGSAQSMEPRSYYEKYRRVLKACGLEGFTYHALRHTFATRCVENDFDLKSLSEILGHSHVSTTLQRYVHPSMSLKRRHMEAMERVAICGQIYGQGGPEAL